MSDSRPSNVGILAMECYFPRNYLPQTALEKADGCEGKYTVGLGQESLAFFDDREDVASVLMSALSRLLEGYGIAPEQVGRLEVGTETLVDKSKSVKTTLLSHLLPGATDVEGVTSTNACYGGTAALLNSVAWVESSAWDGRYAVVVCGDIAVYEKGPARPTGGGGAVAMLIGPDAPLAVVGPRATHVTEVYDFYKPRGDTEYAMVDGKLSQAAYLTAVDECWAGLKTKLQRLSNGGRAPSAASAPATTLDSYAHACLHSPYNKLVQKGFARLVYGDLRDDPARAEWASNADAQKWAKGSPSDTLEDRDAEKVLRGLSESRFKSMCAATHGISRQVGNCYTAAVYMNLLALVCHAESGGSSLDGKRVLVFSYGSGAVATAFTIVCRGAQQRAPASQSADFTLERIRRVVDVAARLGARRACDVAEFEAAMDLRAQKYGACGYTPAGSVEGLWAGAFYLAAVDDKHRRTYGRTPK